MRLGYCVTKVGEYSGPARTGRHRAVPAQRFRKSARLAAGYVSSSKPQLRTGAARSRAAPQTSLDPVVPSTSFIVSMLGLPLRAGANSACVARRSWRDTQCDQTVPRSGGLAITLRYQASSGFGPRGDIWCYRYLQADHRLELGGELDRRAERQKARSRMAPASAWLNFPRGQAAGNPEVMTIRLPTVLPNISSRGMSRSTDRPLHRLTGL